jgi:hypothetical protein
VVAASWVPTALTHSLVEEPFRQARRLISKPSLALGLGVACTTIALLSSVLLVDLQPTERTAPISAVKGAAALHREKAPENEAAALRPDPLKAYADRGRLYADGCLVGIQGTHSNHCLYGDPHGKRTLVLFGDSHAMQYFPPLEKVAEKNHWRVIALVKAECTPAEIKMRGMIADREYSQCDVWRDWSDRIALRGIRNHPSVPVWGSRTCGRAAGLRRSLTVGGCPARPCSCARDPGSARFRRAAAPPDRRSGSRAGSSPRPSIDIAGTTMPRKRRPR